MRPRPTDDQLDALKKPGGSKNKSVKKGRVGR